MGSGILLLSSLVSFLGWLPGFMGSFKPSFRARLVIAQLTSSGFKGSFYYHYWLAFSGGFWDFMGSFGPFFRDVLRDVLSERIIIIRPIFRILIGGSCILLGSWQSKATTQFIEMSTNQYGSLRGSCSIRVKVYSKTPTNSFFPTVLLLFFFPHTYFIFSPPSILLLLFDHFDC